jgi:SagB-type dehydrogenase family enzyme
MSSPSRIGREFMEKTKYAYLDDSDQQRGRPQPPLELPYAPDKVIVELTSPEQLPQIHLDVKTAIQVRKSVRNYAPDPLTLSELSYLLWCTQGIKQTIDSYATRRTVPSAGARHAFETCLLVNRVTELKAGLYRFLASEHQLLQESTQPGLSDRIMSACLDQPHVKSSAVTFIWTAVPYRMTWRYGERGYRYLHLDAGHVCQNLYLAAETIDAGVCAIAAFKDDALNEALGIDGQEQFAIYLATVGKQETT